MNESTYLQQVAATFRQIEDALADVDPTDCELDSTGDVLSFSMRDGVKCILNTQRPTQQLWLAAKARAWHFDYQQETQRWLDSKGRGELFAILTQLLHEHGGISIALAAR